MSKHREQVDKAMMRQINRRVLLPLCRDLGKGRYFVTPYLGRYDVKRRLPDGVSVTRITATSATARQAPTPASSTGTARRGKARLTSGSRIATRPGR